MPIDPRRTGAKAPFDWDPELDRTGLALGPVPEGKPRRRSKGAATYWCVFGVLLATWLVARVQFGTAYLKIDGVCVSNKGGPIAGAVVTLTTGPGTDLVWGPQTVTTGEDGKFMLRHPYVPDKRGLNNVVGLTIGLPGGPSQTITVVDKSHIVVLLIQERDREEARRE